MARRRSRWKKSVPTLATITLTAMPFTVWCSSAQAFFPPINHQNSSPPTVVEQPPTTPPVVVVPPVSPPPVPPVPPPPNVIDPPCDCDCNAPEPGSVIMGITGLLAAAGYRWKKRK